jgi:hypothetical protein
MALSEADMQKLYRNPEDEEKAFSDGYQRAFEDLTKNQGFSPSKARRYLDSIAKRNLKKFLKDRNKRSQSKV